MSRKDEEPLLKEAYDDLKRMATAWNAESAEIKTDDGKWQYTIAVKRLKKPKKDKCNNLKRKDNEK